MVGCHRASSPTGLSGKTLGHSDPSLTANVYTDVPALSLHSEMAELPWITEEQQGVEPASHPASQNDGKMAVLPSVDSLPEILRQLHEILQSVRIQTKTNPAPLTEAGSESVEWLPRLGLNQARPFCKPASPSCFAHPRNSATHNCAHKTSPPSGRSSPPGRRCRPNCAPRAWR